MCFHISDTYRMYVYVHSDRRSEMKIRNEDKLTNMIVRL